MLYSGVALFVCCIFVEVFLAEVIESVDVLLHLNAPEDFAFLLLLHLLLLFLLLETHELTDFTFLDNHHFMDGIAWLIVHVETFSFGDRAHTYIE